MNKKLIFQQLERFIAIESVSTQKNRFSQILKSVDFIKENLKDLGFVVDIYQKNGFPPLIIAKKIVSPRAKTYGFYAHYDVQPEDPVEAWQTLPFKLVLRNGKFYGRGVADDKGHLIILIEAVKNLVENKENLKNNLVFIFEGEEEIGSAHFEELVKKDKFLKKVDGFYVVDMGLKRKDQPQLFYGLRGICEFELEVKVSEYDLHSGVYGNLVENPVQIIAHLLAKIKDEKGRIKIPGFYQKVMKVSKKEKDLLSKSGRYEGKIYPSFDVNGIVSGYIQDGVKTIIPSKALVKFSFRLVPNQDFKKIEKIVVDFIKKNLSKNLKYQIKTFYGSNPFYTSLDNDLVKKTSVILKDIFGKEVVFNRSGGSVPAAEILSRLFKKPVVLLGFTLPDCNLHAPQENFDEECFYKGIKTMEKIFQIE